MDSAAKRPSSTSANDDRKHEIVLLSSADLRGLVGSQVAITAIDEAYKQLYLNRGDQGRSLGFSIARGSIHVKAGLLPGSHDCFAAKINVNLPGNVELNQLPTIQGVVVLVDARNGRPLAIMESMALTAIRTAATAALAARHGARKNSKRLAIVGCGAQAGYQLDAIAACFRLENVLVFDVNAARAEAFARDHQSGRGFRCTAEPSIQDAIEGADICVTCTTSSSPVLTNDYELKGCFIAAVGADNPSKQEIAPALMRRSRMLVDDLDACAAGGDLYHALQTETVSRSDVHADLAELAANVKSGRQSDDELVIFDSTGSGVQDVAVAWVAYQRARDTQQVSTFDLIGSTAGVGL
jgi:ornithine cyclodeaminase/alanine dehydrogenase-like protein (mu-crystallin family)